MRIRESGPTVTSGSQTGLCPVPEKYAQIAWVLGLGGHGDEEARERLFANVEQLLAEVRMPRTNPRMPLLAELRGLLERVA